MTILQNNIISKQSAIESQKIRVNDAEQKVNQLTIKAPFDGVFSADFANSKNNVLRNYPVGAQINANTTLGAVASLSTMQLAIAVDELDLTSVKVGQKVNVKVDAISGKTFQGEVTSVSNVGTTTNGVTTYDAVVSIPNTDQIDLKYAMTATAEIFIQDKKDILVLPIQVVTTTRGKSTVSLKKADGTAEEQHEIKWVFAARHKLRCKRFERRRRGRDAGAQSDNNESTAARFPWGRGGFPGGAGGNFPGGAGGTGGGGTQNGGGGGPQRKSRELAPTERSDSMNIIELNEVTKSYTRGAEELQILRGITLHIAEGDFVAIIGPSGSGKSTLMNTIGLLDSPTSGSYTLDGVATEKMSDNGLAELRNRKIGFIFQQFNLLPRLTATENVELPMIYAGIPAKQRREQAQRMLEKLGMGERGHHKPSELSGGQQQRVAIARALAISPSLILADEPTGALDSKTGIEVLELIKELNRQGNTIVLITHDHHIADNAKRVVTLRDGEIISDQPKRMLVEQLP